MMAANEGEGFNLDDRERLPWLEPAEDGYDEDEVSPARIIGLVLLGLALLALIVGGGWWLKNRSAGGSDAKLIAAQGGPYKVPLNESGGKVFQGEGDASYAASEGQEAAGQIDNSKVPEAPLENVSRGSTTREEAAKPEPKPARRAVTASVKDETRPAKPEKAAAPAPAAVPAGGALIQLGAYGNKAGAQEAWKKFTRRFDYLEPLTMVIEPVSVGGQTLYRLRARTPTAADATGLCGRLRVAGESCMVVN